MNKNINSGIKKPKPVGNYLAESIEKNRDHLFESFQREFDRAMPSAGDIAREMNTTDVSLIVKVVDYIKTLSVKSWGNLVDKGLAPKSIRPKVSINYNPSRNLISVQLKLVGKKHNLIISIDVNVVDWTVDIEVSAKAGRFFDVTLTKTRILDIDKNSDDADKHADDVINNISGDYLDADAYVDKLSDDAINSVTESIDNAIDEFKGKSYTFAQFTDSPDRTYTKSISKDTPAGIYGIPLTRDGTINIKNESETTFKSHVIVLEFKPQYRQSVVVIDSSGRSINYDERKYSSDIEVIKEKINKSPKIDLTVEDLEGMINVDTPDPFKRIMKAVKIMSEKNSGRATPSEWGKSIEDIGIAGIVDLGSGYLSRDKPYICMSVNDDFVSIEEAIRI